MVVSAHLQNSKTKENSRRTPVWALLSLGVNGCLLLLVIVLILLFARQPQPAAVPIEVDPPAGAPPAPAPTTTPDMGPRHKLTYGQWVELLEKEAAFAAETQPERLTILAGDSISLWFPPELLPGDRAWLNQAISGETSTGLFQRLPLLDRTKPETIFVMIGINDLLKGVGDAEILENQWLIIRDLRWVHPETQIVIQSILPHSGEAATWEERDRLLAIPNERIRQLNQQIEAIARERGAYYLDLYSLFADERGNLRGDLTTDGLHLSHKGYLVWSCALQLFSQLELQSQILN